MNAASRDGLDDATAFGVDRRRVMNPARPRVDEALRRVDEIDDPAEAWEALESAGLLDAGTVGAPQRCFSRAERDRAPTDAMYRPTRGSRTRRDDALESPPSLSLAVALASDFDAVVAAEHLAQEAWARLRPFCGNTSLRRPVVCWRFGEGVARDDRRELWFARAYAEIVAAQPLTDAGELRAELRRRPPRKPAEVTALEDGFCAQLLRDESQRVAALREARDDARALAGRERLGLTVRSDDEPNERFWWRRFATQIAVTDAMAAKLMARFPFERPVPDWPTLASPFEPLLAIWHLGYAPLEFDTGRLLLEAPPL